jgi:hypothetical protein
VTCVGTSLSPPAIVASLAPAVRIDMARRSNMPRA